MMILIFARKIVGKNTAPFRKRKRFLNSLRSSKVIVSVVIHIIYTYQHHLNLTQPYTATEETETL